MSLAARTTVNNVAEYVGLLAGLQVASHTAGLLSLSLATAHSRSAKCGNTDARSTPIFLPLHGKARLLADLIGVTSWKHHHRAWNKMADAATNVAIECQRSLQSFHPSDRPEWRDLVAHLPGDFAQLQTVT